MENAWANKAINFVYNYLQTKEDLIIHTAYDVPFKGYECLDKASDAIGFFKFYFYTYENKLGFAIGTHYKIDSKDLINSNMPCYNFSSETKNFKDDEESLKKVCDNIINKIKGLNTSLCRSIISLEKKFIINHDIDSTFDDFTEEVN